MNAFGVLFLFVFYSSCFLEELVNEGNPGKGRPPFEWTNSLSNDLERVGVGSSKWLNEAKDWKLWRKKLEVLSYLPSKRRKGK